MLNAITNPYITYPKDHRKIHKLRDKFEIGSVIDEQLDQYEKALVSDWTRCKTLGVDPALRGPIILPEYEYQTARAASSFLIEKSIPILSKVSSLLVGVPGIFILADNNGVILHIIGDPSVRLRANENHRLVEGSCWLESSVGTNGIGTAVIKKEAVHLYSNEHFCEELHMWSCAGTPILNPFTNEVLGVIDFTTLDKDYRDDAIGITYSLSGHITVELRLQIELERMQIIHSYSDYSSRYPSDEIVVLDRMGHVVRSSSGIDQRKYELYTGRESDKEPPKKFQQIYMPGTDSEIGSLLVVQRKNSSFISLPYATGNNIATFGGFITADENLKLIMERIRKVTPSEINVLLTGETGTGKEIIANYIHTNSKRRTGPFVAVNCGAISKELFESKFFGYERGAFTGADPRGMKGLFECANGGTLFFDEVGEMPLDIQAALLRVLETGRFHRVGSDKEIITDCRIIAATNRILFDEIERGTFRSDLYYRLAVAKFEIPSLKERPVDIPHLIQHTMLSLCRKHGTTPAVITPEAMDLLTKYSWPGNGREVRNVIESAMICGGDSITEQDLPINIKYSQKTSQHTAKSDKNQTKNNSDPADYRTNISEREVQLILTTLNKYKDVSLTCNALGVSRATFYRKCKAHGLTPQDYIDTSTTKCGRV